MRATFKTLFYVNRSKEAREINFALDDIKAQIIKHYQRLSDREAYVTAEMVRNAFQGIGNEYETLLGAFDKDNLTFCRDVFVFASMTALSFVDIKGLTTDQDWRC